MKIEIPKIENYKRINALACQVHNLHVNWRPDLFLPTKEAITKERLEYLIQEKNIYVARLDNEIVGYVIFNIVEKDNPILRYRKQLHIEAMCVDSSYRGKKIGTQLLEFIEQVARKENCTDISLTVNEENDVARKTYEKFGMKVKNIAYSKELK